MSCQKLESLYAYYKKQLFMKPDFNDTNHRTNKLQYVTGQL